MIRKFPQYKCKVCGGRKFQKDESCSACAEAKKQAAKKKAAKKVEPKDAE